VPSASGSRGILSPWNVTGGPLAESRNESLASPGAYLVCAYFEYLSTEAPAELSASAQVNVKRCASARDLPQIGQVLSCLRNGTPVTIDDDPVSVQGTLWWHLAGRGWMAHQLLVV